jgi:hypothetical protein
MVFGEESFSEWNLGHVEKKLMFLARSFELELK